jgi:hypothetical protein
MGYYRTTPLAFRCGRSREHALADNWHGRIRRLLPQPSLARLFLRRNIPMPIKARRRVRFRGNPDGVSLKLADNSPKSALEGPPKFVRDGALTPDFYSVNVQPPYQPSAVKPARTAIPVRGSRERKCPAAAVGADDRRPSVRQGYRLGLYAGAWQATLTVRYSPPPIFQYHRDPSTVCRHGAGHSRTRGASQDGGVDGVEFIKAIDTGRCRR